MIPDHYDEAESWTEVAERFTDLAMRAIHHGDHESASASAQVATAAAACASLRLVWLAAVTPPPHFIWGGSLQGALSSTTTRERLTPLGGGRTRAKPAAEH